jgi:hypothetical protein
MPETSLYGIRMVLKDLDDYRPEQRIHTTLRQELVRSKWKYLLQISCSSTNLRTTSRKPGRQGRLNPPTRLYDPD